MVGFPPVYRHINIAGSRYIDPCHVTDEPKPRAYTVKTIQSLVISVANAG